MKTFKNTQLAANFLDINKAYIPRLVLEGKLKKIGCKISIESASNYLLQLNERRHLKLNSPVKWIMNESAPGNRYYKNGNHGTKSI